MGYLLEKKESPASQVLSHISMDLLHRYIEAKGIYKSLVQKDHLMTAACCVFLATKMISVHIHHVASKIIEFYYDFRKMLLPEAT